jgi:hypothetical protein
MTERGTVEPGTGEPTERRLTPTERYHELAMSVANRQPSSPEHALALTRNAKGDVQIELTVRSADLAELETSATAAFDRLCTKYPRVETGPKGGE